MRFLPAGESALVIELGDAIDPELNARVLALDRALLGDPFDGYLEAVPSYRSLLLFFDPERATGESIEEHVRGLGAAAEGLDRTPPRLREVPTVYDGEDLDDVARRIGATVEEVVRLHSEREYLVYMVGFTPGFAYMGSTHERLGLPRRASPRTRVPAGSVGIAMGQTGIYPSSTPGGWNLLGRAEHRDLFDLSRDPPSYFLPGDRVRFVPVAALPRRAEIAASVAPSVVPALEVQDGGLVTTVQDLGRIGYQRYGVPVAGAADGAALRAANRLAGNEPCAAGLECTVSGPSVVALRPIVAAVTGADLGAVVERADLGRFEVPPWSSFLLRPGNVLRFEGRRSGARAYVAFSGGIDVPEVLGSRSTYSTAGFGGVEGRALRAGDRLGLLPSGRAGSPGLKWPRENCDPNESETRIRVVLGPQDDYFTEKGLATFADSIYTVSSASDRMGLRFEGPALEHRARDFVSDGIMLGGMQVPPNGLPILMLADRATMGGYPKIATAAHADLSRLAQLLPGDRVRFEIVSRDEARSALLTRLDAERRKRPSH
ncbi:MAG TPA: 5-oxoprolinase subunit PxpB [Vicinamibacteria bacterium]|jgi:KipI family sensor histidine kinase inhibitor